MANLGINCNGPEHLAHRAWHGPVGQVGAGPGANGESAWSGQGIILRVTLLGGADALGSRCQ